MHPDAGDSCYQAACSPRGRPQSQKQLTLDSRLLRRPTESQGTYSGDPEAEREKPNCSECTSDTGQGAALHALRRRAPRNLMLCTPIRDSGRSNVTSYAMVAICGLECCPSAVRSTGTNHRGQTMHRLPEQMRANLGRILRGQHAAIQGIERMAVDNVVGRSNDALEWPSALSDAAWETPRFEVWARRCSHFVPSMMSRPPLTGRQSAHLQVVQACHRACSSRSTACRARLSVDSRRLTRRASTERAAACGSGTRASWRETTRARASSTREMHC